jgi:hypothetical protein
MDISVKILKKKKQIMLYFKTNATEAQLALNFHLSLLLKQK